MGLLMDPYEPQPLHTNVLVRHRTAGGPGRCSLEPGRLAQRWQQGGPNMSGLYLEILRCDSTKSHSCAVDHHEVVGSEDASSLVGLNMLSAHEITAALPPFSHNIHLLILGRLISTPGRDGLVQDCKADEHSPKLSRRQRKPQRTNTK